DRRAAVETLLDPVKQDHHRGRADDRIVEHLRHVEPDRLRAKIGQVHLIVEQPGALAIAPPGREPRPEIGPMRAMPAAEQLYYVAQAPVLDRLLVIGVDRILDPRELFAVHAA